MLNVYLTVDTEIWPDNWDMSHKNFPKYYNQYIRGLTKNGEYGLPFQLRVLKEHGLKAVFFVEPLFAHHYGLSPLRDIIAMIRESGQSVELHLHTEWISRTDRIIPPGRFQLNLKDYTKGEQEVILREGLENLVQCGAEDVSAFRAGNFGANRDTLEALAANGILIDSSYNATSPLGPCLDETIFRPTMVGSVKEYPITVFKDGFGKLRHMQVGANSYSEISTVLRGAHRQNWENVTLFWHSSEFLTRDKSRHDAITSRRFTKLCDFLGQHADAFGTRHFLYEDVMKTSEASQPEEGLLLANRLDTGRRHAEQFLRRLRGA